MALAYRRELRDQCNFIPEIHAAMAMPRMAVSPCISGKYG